MSIPKGGADIPAATFLAGKCPNIGRDSMSCRQRIGELFFSSVKLAGKPFQKGIGLRCPKSL